MKRSFTLLCVFLIGSSIAMASDCSEQNLILDHTSVWDFQGSFQKELPLNTRDHFGNPIDRSAYSNFVLENWPYLSVQFYFKWPEDLVGIDYNISRLEIDIGAGNDISHFALGDCESPIATFMPGDPFYSKAIKIEPKLDGSARSKESVHIKIWGK